MPKKQMARIKPGKNTTRKELITRKAATLFKSKGYAVASMRDLAESIGVEAPSLYNHIGSKSEILRSICFTVAGSFTSHLEQTLQGTDPILHKVAAIIRFHIGMMLNDFDAVYVSNHDWKHLDEPYLSDFLNQRREYERKFVQLIQEGARRGEIKDTDPYVVVLTILSAVRGLEFWQHHKKNISTDNLENNMVDHLLNGIAK
ncbi:MAG TPA: TetR/AcrR family transcriptional regulator [Ferruginibacter sp.]|nr:TetR family transcriptional regulator [Ferruginibacter sp.]TXH28862.1 MAG: TetR/AcrR family transcriptional regulator [Cyclobacteriaceae bacterium]HMX36419.1 TetR/AcrR family transcriptional regulator [Ferruginibacter sp.]HMX80952.1 TetR/AcrR family transcriptional regulator [Ferruginibacter sp.]HMZ99738.1 TetR/AcrR family transcriptional regulator [Ferruginibacter sp.]